MSMEFVYTKMATWRSYSFSLPRNPRSFAVSPKFPFPCCLRENKFFEIFLPQRLFMGTMARMPHDDPRISCILMNNHKWVGTPMIPKWSL
jgi:hypothetical protein